jgi:hypothetical protein
VAIRPAAVSSKFRPSMAEPVKAARARKPLMAARSVPIRIDYSNQLSDRV